MFIDRVKERTNFRVRYPSKIRAQLKVIAPEKHPNRWETSILLILDREESCHLTDYRLSFCQRVPRIGQRIRHVNESQTKAHSKEKQFIRIDSVGSVFHRKEIARNT